MGRITTLHGYIQEHPRLDKKLKKHNKSILNNLSFSKDDRWPPLTKEMFHIVDGPKPTYISYFGRIITIGASVKGIESEWEEWLNKFENLLTRIHWIEAKIMIETEWFGLLSYHWKNYNSSFDSNKAAFTVLNDWEFVGDRRKVL